MEDVPEDVAQRLYRLPPDRFVAARDEEVERARQAGDRRRADAIGKLRKPTLAAWLVNLLALEAPDRLAELLELGAQLRAAQRDLRGDELRRLSGERREAVGELVREVRRLAIRAGRSARENLPLTDVETTLGAALADAGTAETVRAGRLTKPIDYAGFGDAAPRPKLRLIDGGGEGGGEPAPAAKAASGAKAPAPAKPAPVKAEPVRTEPDRTALTKAKAELKEATAAEKDAARDLNALTEQLEALKERQAAAQIALRAARLRMRQAERAVERLDRRR